LSEGFFYKFVLKDSADVTIQTYDNLYGIIGATPPAATPIPSGGIFLWSGSIGSIPAGYVLCNGSNGTPDLRDRFVVGAGSTYAVNATGGSADAVVVSHTHSITDPGHSHGISNNVAILPTTANQANSVQPDDAIQSTVKTTGITINTAGVSGTNANLPPYYALCYIMKT
jgi:hypothetical protein